MGSSNNYSKTLLPSFLKNKRFLLSFIGFCLCTIVVVGLAGARPNAGYDIPLQEWVYQRQGNGDLSQANNCGPASVAMVVRAVNGEKYATLKPESVRPNGSMGTQKNTTAAQLKDALDHYDVSYQTINSFDELEKAITERHHMVIALANMGELSNEGNQKDYYETFWPEFECPDPGHCIQLSEVSETDPARKKVAVWSGEKGSLFDVGRYDKYKGQHWLVLKGLKFNPAFLTFRAFDPNVFGGSHYWWNDATAKGLDREYGYHEFKDAFEKVEGTPIAIEITDSPVKGTEPLSEETMEIVLRQDTTRESSQEAAAREYISFIGHENYPPGHSFAQGQVVDKLWKIKNTGETDLGYEASLVQVGGVLLNTKGPIKLTQTIDQGEQVVLPATFQLPLQPGSYHTSWQIMNSHGNMVGDLLPFDFVIGQDVSTPVPEPPTVPASNCPNDGRSGVYFYEDRDFSGACHYATENVSDFEQTAVKDNRLSSIRLIGDWDIRIYEDINYGGRYDVIGSDEPDLDVRSLGGQYSSAKVENSTTTCPSDNREGVYMYSQRNFEGRCLFAVADMPDFGATVLGNNDLSSIRIIGTWETKIFEDINYGGRYDVIGSDDPNLDIRSLGSQYSSIRIKHQTVPPTETPTPTPTAAPTSITLLGPTVNNGGFEAGNMSGWNQVNGSFDVASDEPRSGVYYVKGTSATEAYYTIDLNISDHKDAIDASLGSAFFHAWFNPGKSENFRLIVRLRDASDNDLLLYNSGWGYFAGEDYHQLAGEFPQIPAGVRTVRLEVHSRRTNGDYTDMDADDITFQLQIAAMNPTATPTPIPTPATGYKVVINKGAEYTNLSAIRLKLTAPDAVKMKIQEGASGQPGPWIQFQPVATVEAVTGPAEPIISAFVWFKDEAGSVNGPYADEIIYDNIPPYGWVKIAEESGNKVRLKLTASDNLSGVAEMRISSTRNMDGASWQPYETSFETREKNPKYYAQFKDKASNVSPVYGSDETYSEAYRGYLPVTVSR